MLQVVSPDTACAEVNEMPAGVPAIASTMPADPFTVARPHTVPWSPRDGDGRGASAGGAVVAASTQAGGGETATIAISPTVILVLTVGTLRRAASGMIRR